MDSIIEQLNANLKIVYRQALDADKKLDDLQNQEKNEQKKQIENFLSQDKDLDSFGAFIRY